IGDVLDFSKIEAGKLEIAAVRFSLRLALQETIKTFALSAQEKGIDLTIEIDREVPDELAGDVGRLRQVLVNLIANAIKFTAQGTVAVTVELVSAADTMIRFSVSDTGIGIAQEKRRQIFEPFSQV